MKTRQKTKKFSMVVTAAMAVGLISCTPRDPEVLSKADKDFVQAQKNKAKKGADGASFKLRPTLPKRVDLSFGLLMTDREAEALLILKKAEMLLKTDGDKTQDGCVRTKLVETDKSSRHYQISKDLCQLSFGDVSHTVNGTANLKIELDETGEFKALQYDTADLASESLGITEYQVSKKDVKMSFVVKDEIHLKIDRKPGTKQYRVSSLQTNTSYRQLAGPVETVGQIFYEADGEWTGLETGEIQSQFHGKLRFKSEVTNAGDGTAGGDSYFDLVLDSYNQNPIAVAQVEKCSRAQGVYFYDLSFGNGSRRGTLSMVGDQLVAVNKDPKTQKEEKASLGLKACAQRANLAWDQLMVVKAP